MTKPVQGLPEGGSAHKEIHLLSCLQIERRLDDTVDQLISQYGPNGTSQDHLLDSVQKQVLFYLNMMTSSFGVAGDAVHELDY